MLKTVYEGKLQFIKTTNKMAVYGDGKTLKAQYVPKFILGGDSEKNFPEVLKFIIKASDLSTRSR